MLFVYFITFLFIIQISICIFTLRSCTENSICTMLQKLTILFLVASMVGSVSAFDLKFADVSNGLEWAKSILSNPVNTKMVDPGLLQAAMPLDTPGGFSGYILENFVREKTNVTLSGRVAQDNILNQSVLQMTATNSMAPTVKTPVCTYQGPLDGGKSHGQVSFYMVEKQLVCKAQPALQNHRSRTLDILSQVAGAKFIGFTFINNMLAAGYATKNAEGVTVAFVSAFDGNLLAVSMQSIPKSTTVNIVFLTYDGNRPSTNEVTLPPSLSALCN